jgi:hypothetical protein
VHLALTVWGSDEAIERFARLMRSAARVEGYEQGPELTFSTLPFLDESTYFPWQRLATAEPSVDEGDAPAVDARTMRSLARALHDIGDAPLNRLSDALGAEDLGARRQRFATSWYSGDFGPPDGAARRGSTIQLEWDEVRRDYGIVLQLGGPLRRLDLHYVIRASDRFAFRPEGGGIAMEYFVQRSDLLPQIHVESSDAGAQFVRFLLDTPDVDMEQRLRAWAPTRYRADRDLPVDLAADPGATFQAAGWELVEAWRSGEFDDYDLLV